MLEDSTGASDLEAVLTRVEASQRCSPRPILGTGIAKDTDAVLRAGGVVPAGSWTLCPVMLGTAPRRSPRCWPWPGVRRRTGTTQDLARAAGMHRALESRRGTGAARGAATVHAALGPDLGKRTAPPRCSWAAAEARTLGPCGGHRRCAGKAAGGGDGGGPPAAGQGSRRWPLRTAATLRAWTDRFTRNGCTRARTGTVGDGRTPRPSPGTRRSAPSPAHGRGRRCCWGDTRDDQSETVLAWVSPDVSARRSRACREPRQGRCALRVRLLT
ncbi:hypothetical protein QJS66_10075 [Kocuria rhizophila]|nr:hypothetical protein QJS66_10075 [Kocuria rhizophila]